jgi:prevent-host-death family protein
MRIGVRDLKNRTTQILRQVRENRAEYVVTYYGRPVAVLLPVDQAWLAAEAARAAEAATPSQELAAELADLRPESGQSQSSTKQATDFVWE